MKNIHVLPTNKPSKLQLQMNGNFHIENGQIIALRSYENIYITSDEEIKEGDWFISLYSNSIQRELKLDWTLNKDAYKKITLTTDKDLIKDGIQAIDEDFLEWFVKNPSCEKVEVQSFINGNVERIYELIIPRQYESECICDTDCREFVNVKCKKPKQETLEEWLMQFKNK